MSLQRLALFVVCFSAFVNGVQLAAQSEGMSPFTMDHRRGALTQSPVDVSYLLDAPAGKHGFVQVKDGHLATGDGQRIRFWGVNITDWSKGSRQIPSKEDSVYLAATLARFGVNSVRFQFLDLDVPRGLVKKGTARACWRMRRSTRRTTLSRSWRSEGSISTSTFWWAGRFGQEMA
jgi:hypothetical protein